MSNNTLTKTLTSAAAVFGVIAGIGIAASPSKAAVVIGGIQFEDNAFIDSLISSSGSFTTSGGSLSDVLTDIDPGTYAFSFSNGAFVELGFDDNLLVNGVGDDLALFELGIPDTFKVSVSIGGLSRSYLSSGTGESAGGFNLNVAKINLDD